MITRFTTPRGTWRLAIGAAAVLLGTGSATACAQDRAAPVVAMREAERADRWAQAIEQAERLARQGRRRDATERAERIASAYEQGGTFTSAEHTTAGRAYALLGNGDAEAVRNALRAFDRAVARDSANLDAQRRTGALFLERYNAPEARASYEAVLKRAPTDADALLGLARVEEFEGKPTALATARRALISTPNHAGALAYVAQLQLDAEAFDSASATALQAVKADSAQLEAWAVLGATAWITGDSATYRRALTAATAIEPSPATFYAQLAESAVRQRRYADAVRLAEQAVRLDSLSAPALGVLGTNQLRIGQMDAGRTSLERAFTLDPFNVWHDNTLKLLDKMRGFRTITSGRVQIVAPADEADLMALYLVPLLERAYDSLAVRYGYRPPTPIRLELYRIHSDFSVRTVGLGGLGALGVSFGSLLAMDTPNARERGTFNYGSTAWHELAHAFTLGASAHRVPRWLSEGLSVLEERRANVGWGARTTLGWMQAYRSGRLNAPSRLTDGFMRPRYPQETSYSYYHASLFCEWVERTRGAAALPALLQAYRDGLTTPAAWQRVLQLSPEQVDSQFDAWLKQRFAGELAALGGASERDSSGGAFVATMRQAMSVIETRKDSARVLLERARQFFPSFSGDDGPQWLLTRVALDQRDTTLALAMLEQVTDRDETAYDANKLEYELRRARGDRAGAMAALERAIWVWPYDVADHDALATLATAQGDHARAVRERRAVIALRPGDALEARLQLARALAASGDVSAARRELLQILEEAPSYEDAQALLLELRRRGGNRP